MVRSLLWSGLAAALLFLVGYSVLQRFVLAPPVDPYVEDPTTGKRQRIQVLILNGCGIPGVARRALRFLRQRHFDVVDIGNYSRFDVKRSFVIDCVGIPEAAQNVAYALGIPDSLVVQQLDSSLFVHCTVVLGQDVKQLKFYANAK